MTLLQLNGLTVSIGANKAVDDVSLSLAKGETFVLLGESGCGKSMTALALMRLLPTVASLDSGSIQFAGEELLALQETQMRRVRGGRIAMIFQEPATSLNPVMTVGAQIAEALQLHGRAAAAERVVELLTAVGIPDPQRRAGEYPFQMSGGMKQRAMIAMALAGEPDLLIADEPTTALDVTIQAQVLDLLRQLQAQRGMAILLITHDLGIAARMADQIGVMHQGRLVEIGPPEQIFGAPEHAHTRRLFAALPENLPKPEQTVSDARDLPLLVTHGLTVHFPTRRGIFRRAVGQVRAVDGLDLELCAGRTLALVGESGCGKTTAGKAILGLQKPTAGQLSFNGEIISGLHPARMQMVFQDPFGSLNPRMRIAEVISEGRRDADVDELLRQVDLQPQMAARYPHEFSGGQRQRIAIARALAVEPQLLICDEPTSALDVSVQAQVLALLTELQRRLNLAYLFITHNIAVVDYLAHEVAVMYLGRIVERGSTEEVLRTPRHPYTQALLAAVPRIETAEQQSEPLLVAGDPPSPAKPPAGCHFHPRCPKAEPRCRTNYPTAVQLTPSHSVRCLRP